MLDTNKEDPNFIGEKKLSAKELVIIQKMKAGEIEGIRYPKTDPKGDPKTHVLIHKGNLFCFDEERKTLAAQNFVLENLQTLF